MAAPLSAAHGMFELLSSVQQECDEQGLGPEDFLLMACRTLAQQIGALPAAGEGEAGETGDDADDAERLRELTFCGTRFIQGWLNPNGAARIVSRKFNSFRSVVGGHGAGCVISMWTREHGAQDIPLSLKSKDYIYESSVLYDRYTVALRGTQSQERVESESARAVCSVLLE